MHAGEFFASGAFVPNSSGHHVARWTGTTWQAVGPVFSGQIYDLLSWNGDLIAAGQFMTIGGANIPRIARWTGSTWLPLAPAIDGPVWALTTWGGALIAAGDFQRVSGDATGVAKWDGTSWHALGVGQGVAFTGFAEIHDALWATASSITNSSIPGPVTGSLRRWDGTAWQTVGTMNSEAYAVREYQGQTIVGGAFTSVDGTPAAGIAVWTGSAWNGLGGGFSSIFGGVVRALAVYNGELIAAGSFSAAGGVAANNIARWNGTTWQPLGAGLNGTVRALAEFNGELVAGGSFIGAGESGALDRPVERLELGDTRFRHHDLGRRALRLEPRDPGRSSRRGRELRHGGRRRRADDRAMGRRLVAAARPRARGGLRSPRPSSAGSSSSGEVSRGAPAGR